MDLGRTWEKERQYHCVGEEITNTNPMFVRRSKQKIVKYTNRSAVSPEERVVIKFTRKQGHFLRSLDSLLDNVHTVQSYSPEARTFRASRTIDQEPLNTVLYLSLIHI